MLNIKQIYELNESDIELFGAKAVNLSLLKKSGLNVPKGYCISKEFHEQMIDSQVFDISEDELEELKVVFDSFENKKIAVRSSAISEDLSNNSFAGLYESFLNIDTFENFIEAIKACILSSRSERVKEYIEHFKLKIETPLMAIIIQKMINSESAGVAFTENPINNRSDELLINSNWGLGENVVDGMNDPDEWIVGKKTKEIKESKISNSKASLKPDQINMLVENLIRIEKSYKKPQDIEWAFENDELFFLQTRDITTLYPTEEAIDEDKLRLYMCYNTIIQGINEPFTPIGSEFWRVTFAGYTSIFYNFKKKIMHPSWLRNINGRLYYDITEVIGRKLYFKKIPNSLDQKDPAGGKLMEEILQKYKSVFLKQGGKFRISFGIIKWGMSLMKHGKLSKKDPGKAVAVAQKIGNDYYNELKIRISACKSVAEKINMIECFAEEYLSIAFIQVMHCSHGLKAVEKQDKWMERNYGDMFDLNIIRQGLPNNPTTEMGLELSRIAKEYKALDRTPDSNDDLITEFIKKYGHRGTIEVDFGCKRWKDDIEYPISLIKQYMNDDIANDNVNKFKRQNVMALEIIDDIYSKVKEDKGIKKAKSIKSSYLNFRTTAGIRELPKFDMLRCMDLLIDMVKGIAADMVVEGIISIEGDINFLEFDQIINHEKYDIKKIIEQAKVNYNNQSSYEKIPRFILSNGECYYQQSQNMDEDNVIKGISISSGTFEGIVKVLHSPDSGQLSKENVLVTHNTNPAWTPLFLNVGALVMENGGPISHGAIVAREYGLPAVAGIPNATKLLKDGDRVLVNGEKGIVRLLH